MKKFLTYLIIGLIILLSIVLGIGYASADEVQKDCNYMPTQSDQVRYDCEINENGVVKKLVGEGEVRVWICGKKYTIEIDCKPKAER